MKAQDKSWLDKPENVTKVFYGVVAVCVLSIVAELFIHKHGHLSYENWFGFHGWYGFVGCVLLVLIAKQLRKILMRGENYYD